MFKNACRTCNTIFLVFLTNNITAFWSCRCRSRRRFLNSLFTSATEKWNQALTGSNSKSGLEPRSPDVKAIDLTTGLGWAGFLDVNL